MFARGVREAVDGVPRNGGVGNPGSFPERGLRGVELLVGGGAAGSIPAARKRSSKEFGSGMEVVAGAEMGGAWYWG
jgi:hypothetical protein